MSERVLFLSFLVFSMALSNLRAQEPGLSTAEKLLNAPRPLVIAHRGFSMIAPENTLASFEYALAAGADLVELDYHHSQEGVPVVIHDATLDRTTDATNRFGGSKISVSW